MKKLIMGIAAIAATTAMAEIVSSSVVGYSNGDLREGFKAAGAQFVPVSGTTIDLTDITVSGYDKEEGTAGEVSVQTLDKNGSMVAQYYWYDAVDGADVYYGWYDADAGDFVAAGAVTLNVGDGLWVDAPSSAFKLQTSGQVMSSSAAVTLREGFKMVANPTPLAVDLTDITVTGYDAVSGSAGEASVQTLDKNGSMVSQYYWYDAIDGADVYYGWYDADAGDFVGEGDVAVGAGEALWVDAPSTDFSLVLPGVTL